ncbi:PrkA AAA domain protein [Bordetella pertussis CHLA-11]|nr:PrkA AAA domain protein [Bordetella pertussis CHLA-11]
MAYYQRLGVTIQRLLTDNGSAFRSRAFAALCHELGIKHRFTRGDTLEQEYGIARRYLSGIMSPWAVKRLREFDGDISQFRVVRLNPSVLRQVAIAKTEPGDENNQDISSLVGKVDIRKLERYAQDDPDAYSYSGGLCLANQGLLEFVEMFKAPIKMLHPLLTAT